MSINGKQTKRVICTGVSGQDGAYMVDFLLKNTDYTIFGMVRQAANPNYCNIQEYLSNSRFKLITADLTDSHSLNKIVSEIKPDYFINFAAQSFVGSSWDVPEQTFDTNATGVLRVLEALKAYAPCCRSYYAGSSEELGDVLYSPQDEKHPLRARSPYGASKIAARQIVKSYRESYGMYAIQGMLYNHESRIRAAKFSTRKITLGVARINYAIKNNKSFEPIELGNINSKRDWSHAADFISCVWKMLNQELHNPILKQKLEEFKLNNMGSFESEVTEFLSKNIKEYVLSSNETHSIREFVELAFKKAGIEGYWEGAGLNEKFILANYQSELGEPKSRVLVSINSAFFRPADVELLYGDSSLARKELGWSPKYTFDDLVTEMVKSDIKNYKP